jgi:hypothetical protein
MVAGLAGWVAWPAQLLLSFVVHLIDAFAALPWAGANEHLGFAAMFAAYAVVLVLTIALGWINRRAGRHRPAEPPRRRLTDVA